MVGTTLDQFSGENPIAREQGIVNWEQALLAGQDSFVSVGILNEPKV